ncbi:uncharacterized protein LOC143274598 isoform X1 [Babylonia areolata]|uniref:uncharacterized protein LOC143274598 isoform X1 n=1 Tax=Babylonia areolata TaxID=304850 RepID=UPI003FD54BDC
METDKEEIIRKRVLYIGSAVPMETAEGLEAIQRPLAERYPVDEDSNIEGILCFLAVQPGGLTMQYVSDPSRILFFPITSLTLCAAVRCVSTVNAATGERTSQFVSLSSPAAGGANSKRPAIFSAITRRTEGRKVLECHGFICSSSTDALELVQCTSYADRSRKGTLQNGGVMPPAGTSFRMASSASQKSFPSNSLKTSTTHAWGPGTGPPAGGLEAEPAVRLVAGADRPDPEVQGQQVAPEFYEAPPQHGYFYKTKDSQIKTYTVERVMEGEAERLRAVPPHLAPTLTRGPPSDRRPHPHPHPPPPGSMTMPHPHHGRSVFPVRSMPPSATLIRPRFFSPPPPMLRPRPLVVGQPHVMAGDPYVFHPPPPNVIDAPYGGGNRRRHQRRGGSDSSSRGSSASSSPGSPPAMNGRRGVLNGDGGDGSSDVSSRPRTPPTDYDRGPRVSRKDQFVQRQRYLNGGPGHYSTLPGGPPPPPPAHPYDFYVYPHRYPYAGYPPYMMERARSVPPPAQRGHKSKERKKNRKGKKEKKKKAGRPVYGVPSDISTDSVGYTSEVGPAGEYPRMPRDFRRMENQFKHERAFSKSLAEEFRGGPGEGTGNAYSLNEHMVQRGAGHEPDFHLY